MQIERTLRAMFAAVLARQGKEDLIPAVLIGEVDPAIIENLDRDTLTLLSQVCVEDFRAIVEWDSGLCASAATYIMGGTEGQLILALPVDMAILVSGAFCSRSTVERLEGSSNNDKDNTRLVASAIMLNGVVDSSMLQPWVMPLIVAGCDGNWEDVKQATEAGLNLPQCLMTALILQKLISEIK